MMNLIILAAQFKHREIITCIFHTGYVACSYHTSSSQTMFYMCKSHKICKKIRNLVLKIFFRAHLPDLVFPVACSIYRRAIRRKASFLTRTKKSQFRTKTAIVWAHISGFFRAILVFGCTAHRIVYFF